MALRRWKLTLEFDGRPFVGWQKQNTGVSVQELLEKAFHSFSSETVEVVTSGRTDAGVHALGLVAHVDLLRSCEGSTIVNALNFYLRPYPVVVLSAEPVSVDFHARFSCRGRAYIYRILNRIAPPALDIGRAWHIRAPLNEKTMHAAAQTLLGKHDFSTFRDSECQAKSPLRTLDKLDVYREGEMVFIATEALSFLHHQVRNMVGTLKLVGEGKWPIERVRQALEACDRTAGGPTAPPEGLYFVRAWY